jgi:hypothetical protein
MMLGVIDPENSNSEPESGYQNALIALNDMIGSWNLENLLVYAVNINTFTFVAGQQVYQVGSQNPFVANILGSTMTVTAGTPIVEPGATLIAGGVPPSTTVTGLLTGNQYGLSWTAPNPITQVQAGLCIGTNWNIPRPTRIQSCSVLYPGAAGQQVEIPISIIDVDHWQSISVKSIESIFPTAVYNDTNYPYMNLYFYPVPATSCNCVLYTWDQLEEVTGLISLIDVPQGYNEALKYNMAVRLAPYYGVEPSQTVVQMAIRSKSNINDINSGIPIMTIDCFGRNGTGSIGLKSRGFNVP